MLWPELLLIQDPPPQSPAVPSVLISDQTWTLFFGFTFFFCFFFVFMLGSTLTPLKEAGPLVLLGWRARPGPGPLADLPPALLSFFFSDLLTRMDRPSSLLPSSFRASWTASAL